MRRNALMIQGCTSDAGKSAIAAGLCRVLRRRGVNVAPFKPQNMALNSAVTADGGEIGRAQALQAQAAGIAPHTDMNPVLLKPNSETGSQVIVHGRALENMDAAAYYEFKPSLMPSVLESFERLSRQYEFIIVEGAGSPAEINLRQNDIANMGFAEAADIPVWLCADIERGGVFAHLYGTLALLSKSEQDRLTGFIINRFRGERSILKPGLDWLEDRTHKPVLGVLPYLENLHLDAEDSLKIEYLYGSKKSSATPGGEFYNAHSRKLRILAPRLPRMSNHTDFEPLNLRPDVELHIESYPQPCDLVILPGTKSVQSDLEWLIKNGWREFLLSHLRYNGKIIGICGGFQMLGNRIDDPHNIEGKSGPGLGLLNVTTTLQKSKHLEKVSGTLHLLGESAGAEGYEIHSGVTSGPGMENPPISRVISSIKTRENGDKTGESQSDGAISPDGQILGTYFHGIFENAGACSLLLKWAGLKDPSGIDYNEVRESAIDKMADAVEKHIDLSGLWNMAETPTKPSFFK